MLKSRGSCQTLIRQPCLVCHNCTSNRGDLQGPKRWMVRQLFQTAGVHAQQAVSSPNRNEGVRHQHLDADEKKNEDYSVQNCPVAGPITTTIPVRKPRGLAISSRKKKPCNSPGRGGITSTTPSRLLQRSPGSDGQRCFLRLVFRGSLWLFYWAPHMFRE